MQSHVNGLHHHIESALPRLLSFVEDLDEVQQKAIQQIGPAAVHLIGWAWLHRASPPVSILSSLWMTSQPPWRECASTLLCAWDQAESLQQLRGELAGVTCASSWQCIGASRQVCLPFWLFGIIIALLPVAATLDARPMQRSGRHLEANDWLVTLGYPPASPTPARSTFGFRQTTVGGTRCLSVSEQEGDLCLA